MSGALKQVRRRLEAAERQLRATVEDPLAAIICWGAMHLLLPHKDVVVWICPVSNHPRLKAPTQAVERACRSLVLIEQPL